VAGPEIVGWGGCGRVTGVHEPRWGRVWEGYFFHFGPQNGHAVSVHCGCWWGMHHHPPLPGSATGQARHRTKAVYRCSNWSTQISLFNNIKITILFTRGILMKIFRSNNSEVIAECRRYFQFNLPSELIEKKKIKFEWNYNRCTILRDMCVRQWNIVVVHLFKLY